ncbi:TPA: hypothetical protein DCX16_04580 [bacterium]|nr:hypothetical protein [bacterium]
MERKLVFVICIFALILRLGWVIHLRNTGLVFADSGSYDQLGTSLAQGKGYVDAEGNPTAMRSPGYPIFVGIIYWLFGEHNLFAVRIFQVILGTLTCLFIFLIGKRVFNPQVGLIGCFLASWNPQFIFYSGYIMQEVFFTFIIILTLYFLCRINDGIKFIFLSGLFGGLSVLTKEVFILYFPLLFIGLMVVIKGRVLVKFKNTTLLFLIIGLMWSPWFIRNYFIYGSFITRGVFEHVCKGGDLWMHLWHGNNQYMGVDFEKECWFIAKGSLEELVSIPPEERKEYVKNKVLELFFSDPWRILKVQIIKLGRFFRLYPHKTKLLNELTQKTTDWVKIVSLLSDGWIIPLALIGFLLSLSLWRQHLLISLWIWSQAVGITIVYYPMIRYRFPVMPIIMLFAGYGLFFIWKSFLLKRIYRNKESL